MKKATVLLLLLLTALAPALCRAAPSPSLRFLPKGNGELQVSWRKMEGNCELRFSISGGSVLWGTDQSIGIDGTAFTLSGLVPGQTYTIYVENGEEAYQRDIEIPTSDFTGFRNDIEINLQPRSATGEDTTNLKAFSVADLEDHAGDTAYGLKIVLKYPSLSKSRSYKRSFAFVSPEGYMAYTADDVWELPTRGTDDSLQFYDLGYVFNALKEDYGSIPVGTYRLELYLDGGLAGSRTFKVEP